MDAPVQRMSRSRICLSSKNRPRRESSLVWRDLAHAGGDNRVSRRLSYEKELLLFYLRRKKKSSKPKLQKTLLVQRAEEWKRSRPIGQRFREWFKDGKDAIKSLTGLAEKSAVEEDVIDSCPQYTSNKLEDKSPSSEGKPSLAKDTREKLQQKSQTSYDVMESKPKLMTSLQNFIEEKQIEVLRAMFVCRKWLLNKT